MIVFVTKQEFEQAQNSDYIAEYYLTIEDLFENEGFVEYVEIEVEEEVIEVSVDNSINISGIEIDLNDINMN